MNRKMTKRALIAIIPLMVAGIVFAGFKIADKPQQKDSFIISIVEEGLNTFHFKPKELNDELSTEVFDEYMVSLDRNKLFFLKSEVKQLEVYRDKIDDEFKSGSSVFFDMSYEMLQNGFNRAQGFYEDILAKPFDFEKNEETWNNPEKLSWAKNESELKDYWRKYLKWRIANRIYNKESNYEDDVANGEKDEPFDFAAAETKARKDELEMIEDWFETLKEMERIEWLGVYINSLTQVFDPHTEYMPPQQQEDFEERMTGQFEGIGAQLRIDGDYIVVEKIITGSASWRQGDLEPGDKIIQVAQGEEEPVDVVGWRLPKAVKIIRGKKGSEVRLTVKKKDGSRSIIPIIRDVVEIEATFAKSAVLGQEKKVGYIRLPSFYVNFYNQQSNHDCAEDVKNEILKLKEEGVEGLIFDLRSNGGGSLDAAIEIVGLFIERGPVVQVRSYKKGTQVKQNRDPKVYWDGPLVVMVNDYSASASEIFSAAIQDYNRGIIIGTKSTFGKGTVQNMIDFDRAIGSSNPSMKPLGALKVTTDKFYRINGGTTQLNGVVPDIILPDAYEYVKTGEKEYEYALGFDEIPAATYSKWNKGNQTFSQVIDDSQTRINGNDRVDQFNEYALWLKQQDEDKMVPLKYSVYKALQDKNDEVAEKYKNLNRSEDSMAVWALQLQLQEFKTDTVKKVDYQKWFKNLSKDLFLQEAVKVVEEIN